MLLNLMQGGELPRIMGPVHRGHVFSRAPDQWHFFPDDNACSHSRFAKYFYSYSSIFICLFLQKFVFSASKLMRPSTICTCTIVHNVQASRAQSLQLKIWQWNYSFFVIDWVHQECISRKSRYRLKKWSGSVPPCCIVLPCPSWAHSSHCPGSDGVSQRNWITNCSR